MGNHHDSIALDWVRGEIEQTLTQSQQALEAYVDNRDDTARLRFCLNYLHQVHGTLQMVELHGAALLTEEMEKLTRAILGEEIGNIDQAVDVLMEAILQLPRYLDNLLSSQDDFPLALLPLLNDLRAVRGESLLSDLSVFNPDLSAAEVVPSPKAAKLLQDAGVRANVRKLGQMYHRAVTRAGTPANLAAALGDMHKVILRLVRLCQGTPRQELWRAAGGFTEALEQSGDSLTPATQTLLEELDHEIDRLTEEPRDILLQPVPTALFKHLLYYVARADDTTTPYIADLRQRYQLAQALPSEQEAEDARRRVSGPGRDAIHSVVVALTEEVARLKDQLDLFVRDQSRSNADLEELLPGLSQVSNTLAVVGLGMARRVVTEQIELVERLIGETDTVDDGVLLDIAGALLYVEASLSGLDQDQRQRTGTDDSPAQPGHRELGEANSALLRESRNSLEQVKSAVVNFIASQWDPREIEHVPELLYSIEGGLRLVPLERAADVLASAGRYVREALLESRLVPDWKQLDTLADAITSIEYYLERLAEGIQDNEPVLRVAEQSLATLGFPVGAAPTWTPDASPEPAEAEADLAPASSPGEDSDSELVDDEILEIFIEEAGEVLETIHAHYPQWRRNPDHRDALIEVRRAYHTLKGSGRLVGAVSIGELAWAIENLLNGALDQSLNAGDDLFALVDAANSRIPELIEEFRGGRVRGDVDSLISRAEAMATTRKTGPDSDSAALAGDAHGAGDAGAGDWEEPAADPAPVTTADDTPEPADMATAETFGQDDLIDDEIIEIFVEEAAEVLATINENLPTLLRQHDNNHALAEVRRAFHTLKGSGRMVGALVVGELAWSVENMLNRVIEGNVFMNDSIAALLQEVTGELPALVGDFEHQRPASLDTGPLRARADTLAAGGIPDAGEMPAADSDVSDGARQSAAPEIPAQAAPEPDEEDLVDPVLVEIFETETRTHLQSLEDFIAEADDRASVPYTDQVSRALHTLKGSAHTAGIEPIARVITPLEQFVKQARAENRRADQDVLALLTECCEFLRQGLGQIHSSPQAPLPGTDEFLQRLDTVAASTLGRRGQEHESEAASGTDPQLVALFLGDGLDVVLEADAILESWAGEPSRTEPIDRLSHELEQLTLGAGEAGLTDVAELTDALAQVYANARDQRARPDAWFLETVRSAHEQLINLMDQVAAGLATQPDPGLLVELEALRFAMDHSAEAAPSGVDAPAGDTTPDTTEAETDDITAELVDIFLAEARDLIDSTGDALESWSSRPDNMELLRLLQRDLHTLKGGARLADCRAIGDLAHELENLFEGLGTRQLTVSNDLFDLLMRCHDRLAGMVHAMTGHQTPRPAPDLIGDIRDYMNAAAASRTVTDISGADRDTDAGSDGPVADTPDREAGPETEDADTGPETTADSDGDQEDETGGAITYDLSHLDPELLGIFLEEAYDLINATASALHSWNEEPRNQDLAAELQRDLHTLKGGARMAGVAPIADLCHVLEELFERVSEGRLQTTETSRELLFACHDRLAVLVEDVASSQPCDPVDDLVSKIHGLLAQAAEPEPDHPDTGLETEAGTDPDSGSDLAGGSPAEPAVTAETGSDDAGADDSSDQDLIGLFLEEGLDIHESIEECLAQWQEDPDQLTGITQLQQELHTLKGGARLADIDAIGDLAQAWSDSLEPLIGGSGNQPLMLSLSQRANQTIRKMLAVLEDGATPQADTGMIRLLEEAASHQDDPQPAPAGEPASSPRNPADDAAGEEVDTEILEIFLEEAGDILDQFGQLLEDWRREPTSPHFNQEIQRALHTLKGGARLSQLPELGNEAHDLEARLTALEGAPDADDWEAINTRHERLIALTGDVRSRFDAAMAGQAETPAAAAPTPPESAPETAIPTAPSAPKPAPQPRKAAANRRQQKDAARAAQETIRVSAPLLDEMVNLAGETSITRGRLEQQTSDFSHTLDEMAVTIDRLREQLRRMDIETETQILFRAEQEHGPEYGDDFDPLEMDRYSSIQQLSRALTESSSDLADLRETLADRVRDTETLLVQQSRINTELQEGLMKTRMIPFSSMVPRLRRIVRQIGSELEKQVEFDVRNAEGEMDRNILERMIAPLEHMLRNALDHGIESPRDRRQAGKPETGAISLTLTREGGEVVLRMVDDGAGIPVPVIRDKAIERGLLGPEEDLSDREILQFILQPGFSTARELTQISGRGVGMDVVASEIKQLGGSLDIDSEAGRGTTFTVRLPFTVSVNRALMVSTGEDFYAIPLNTIEGIVRVSTWELEEYYQPDAPLYEYAGQNYRLQYLGGLLHSEHRPKLQGQALPLPVILVRGSSDQPMALQVDSIMGSREIVVKSLGPQFTSVRGVSGATILGDGNVVVILDLPAMIRSDILSERQRLAQQLSQDKQYREDRATLVMVVDDSVTVRKVTSRLLERNGMEVITAKDGLDAVAQLQDHQPDIMLLDIEMPRMDGFEVASFVRHDDNLRGTPICMITSRTGQKHRDRALALGVNEYLGKPFQESELLETIARLTGKG